MAGRTAATGVITVDPRTMEACCARGRALDAVEKARGQYGASATQTCPMAVFELIDIRRPGTDRAGTVGEPAAAVAGDTTKAALVTTLSALCLGLCPGGPIGRSSTAAGSGQQTWDRPVHEGGQQSARRRLCRWWGARTWLARSAAAATRLAAKALQQPSGERKAAPRRTCAESGGFASTEDAGSILGD